MIALAEIGSRIEESRKGRKLTQLELAKRSGVSRQTIDLLENGRATEIGYSKLARILTVLGLELRIEPIAPARPTLDDLLKDDSHD